jgi:pimeloyl-ACP methyl ester carboxylesterase
LVFFIARLRRMSQFVDLDPSKLFGLPAPHVATLDDGLHIPFTQTGHEHREVIVFVHGSLCDFRYWKPQLGPLARMYRCVAPSLSHYWPWALMAAVDGSTRAFSWDAHVDEVAEFIERLDVGPVHVVGHSRGGSVAFHLAGRYPERVKSLVLADPGGAVASEGSDVSSDFDSGSSSRVVLPAPGNALRGKAAELIAAGDVDAGLELFVDSVSRPGFWARSPKEFRAMASDNARTLLLQFCDPLPAFDARAAGRIECPTLLIDGANSPRMFRDAVGALEGWIDGVQRITIEGASHGMSVTHAGFFNRALMKVIDRGRE